MSEDSRKIVAVVAVTLVTIGVAIGVGAWLLQGHDVQPLTYRQAARKAYPDPTLFKTVVGKGKPGIDVAKMLTPGPKVIAHGKQIYATYCVACHGANGKGDGPAAVALKPPPRDFTSPKGWKQGYSLADLYVTLSEGVKGTPMPAFNMLSPPDRFALAHYIESLGSFDHHDHTAEEIEQLNQKYHLSEGEHAPNKVAVPTVMKHEVAEFVAPPAVRVPPASDDSAGAALCRRLIANPARAAEVLSEVPDWRTNLDAFARVAIADTPRNGFRTAVATLTRAQWTAFHHELVARTPLPTRKTSSTD